MIAKVDVAEYLELSRTNLTVDVRSEGEFKYGHKPGSMNIPLFDNEERKVVGTIYKEKGKNEALLAGLDFVGKKMSGFLRAVESEVKNNKILLNCWRGGMRSGSMAWLYNLYGYDVYILNGGYKSYRHEVLHQLEKKYKLLILGGRTGSGKTEILSKLKELGEQVIDLEELANHKGSAFGALGKSAQPSTEHFENMLVNELMDFDINKRIWLEDESRTIGSVFITLPFWNHMRVSPLFVIDLPFEVRVKRLVSDYGENDLEGLEQSITNIKKRLGNEQWKNAIDAVASKRFRALLG